MRISGYWASGAEGTETNLKWITYNQNFQSKIRVSRNWVKVARFFFPGTIFTTNRVIWVSSTIPAGRIRFWIATLSLPCDLYHISVWQHLCSHRYETWTERSEVPQYDYDHRVHWRGPSDNSSKKRGKNYENKRLVKLNLWCAKQCLFH